MSMSHVDDGTLHAYLDGELTPAEAQGVDAHVAQCPVCRNRLDEERALIARADELLGLAAPPERALPPFRPGDLKPPARLWWQLRFPLAWAATVLVALGVGTFVGSRLSRGPSPLLVDRVAEPAPVAVQSRAETATAQVAPRALTLRNGATKPAAPPPAAPAQGNAGVLALAERKQEPESRAYRYEARDERAARERQDSIASPAAALARAPAPQPSFVIDGYVSGDTLTLDSARALLGTDPLAVPGLPITGIHRARRIGYSALVVVEQSLDSGKTIAVINGRPNQVTLDAIVVSGAARADSMSATERAPRGRAAGAADSAQVTRRKASAAVPREPARGLEANQARPALFLEVRGALSADSLAALRRRLEPLRP